MSDTESMDGPEVDLHVTNRCMARCDHCIYGAGLPLSDEMSKEEISTIFEGLQSLHCVEIHLTGGEPLLRDDLLDIVHLGMKRGFRFRLQSNGLLLVERANDIYNAGIRDVLISIDGPSWYHDAVRGVCGLHSAAEASVRVCSQLGMTVRVNTVLRKSNLTYLRELFRRSGELGATLHSFFFLTLLGRGKHVTDPLSAAEYAQFTHEFAQSLSPAERVRFRCQAIGEPLSDCRMIARDKILILADGRVYPCVFLYAMNTVLGNARDQPIDRLWRESPVWREIEDLAAQTRGHHSCPVLQSLYYGNRQAVCCTKTEPGNMNGCIRRYSLGLSNISVCVPVSHSHGIM